MTDWVIGYDIANPRRLAKVYRRLCGHATPLEYSVFLLVGTERAKENCLEQIAGLIDNKEDDVRCYPLPVRGYQARIGRSSLPGGIQWTGLPAAVQ
ncbi:MAG: CRISPR-associated endonuclease Cas2 [Sulfuritalea sp.]|nr:CRISPR-associated endonuclease Cas2 [Sulfuritalea sp.]